MLLNVGSGGGAAAAAPGAAAGGAGGAAPAAEEAKEEAKEEGELRLSGGLPSFANKNYRKGRIRRRHGFRFVRLSTSKQLRFESCIKL